MILKIPGQKSIELKHVIFDYNGTIAIDGKLIEGVGERINAIAQYIHFHVLTADTYGSVKRELEKINCRVVKVPESQQDAGKLDYLLNLGKENTLCVGNGKNDRLMLKEAVIGIAVIQEEGVCAESLLAADIVCKSIMDVFAYFENPDRIRATLRN